MIRMMLLMMNRKKQWELLGALGRRRELILSVLKAAIHPHAPSSYSNTALKYNTDTDTGTNKYKYKYKYKYKHKNTCKSKYR